MSRPHPAPIIPKSNRLLLAIEAVVVTFPVKHRHQGGARMRDAAEQCALLAQQAWRAGGKNRLAQSELVQQFIDLNETLKLRLQIAYRLQCFSSPLRFAEIATLTSEVGRQAGGWKREIDKHLNGQNPPTLSPPERPKTLSTHAACTQANP